MTMEVRLCQQCGRKFRVLHTSATGYCSQMCQGDAGIDLRATWRNSEDRAKLRKTGIENVNSIIQKSSEPKSASVVKSIAQPIQKKNESEPKLHTTETKKPSTLERPSGKGETLNTSQRTEENITPITKSGSSLPSLRTGTDEIPPESFEELQRSLDTEGLNSLQLLKKSANKLMQLMEESVSSSDLQRGAEGGLRPEGHKIELALRCATALAQTVQTQCNVLKVMQK